VRAFNWAVALVACVVLVGGCEKADQTEVEPGLGEDIERARRMFGHARGLMGRPHITVKGEPVRWDQSLRGTKAEEVQLPATVPAEHRQAALDQLNKAAGELRSALEATPEAPLHLQADARLLLGQIHQARGLHLVAEAQSVREEVEGLNARINERLGAVQRQLGDAEYARALATPRTKKLTDRKKQMQAQRAMVQSTISELEGEVKKAQQQIDKLAKANTANREKAEQLRRRSGVATGQKSLDLLKRAQAVEAEIRENSGKMAALRQKIEAARTDLRIARSESEQIDEAVKALDKKIAELAAAAKESGKAAEEVNVRAAESARSVESLIQTMGNRLEELSDREQPARKALEEASSLLSRAAEDYRQLVQAVQAGGGEGMAGEKVGIVADQLRVASALSAAASADVALGDLGSRRLATQGSAQWLAEQVAKVWQAVGMETPPSVAGLKGYLDDREQVAESARGSYTDAINALERATKLRLGGDARHAEWIFQAQLADAYLGRYRLSGDGADLTRAQAAVNSALEGREASPLLKEVVALSQQIAAEGG
jgi:uncharacterized phage infection (PIP) family protein YhgE